MKLSARLCQIAVPLIAALLAGANVASASSIYTYSTYTVPGEQTIMITSPADTFAGMGQIDLDGTGASAGIDIMAWCLDPYSALLGNGNGGSGPFTYNITQPLLPSTVAAGFGTSMSSPSGMLSATQIAEIGGLMAYGNANIGTANVSAAAQLAIWEVEYGSNFSFTGVSDATSSLATTLIGDLGSSIALNSDVALLTAGNGETNQTLGFIDPTPLPAALPLFATGLGAIGLLGWRRKRKAQTVA